MSRQAEENSRAYLALVARLIPTTYAGGDAETTARPLPEVECWIIETDGTRHRLERR